MVIMCLCLFAADIHYCKCKTENTPTASYSLKIVYIELVHAKSLFVLHVLSICNKDSEYTISIMSDMVGMRKSG